MTAEQVAKVCAPSRGAVGSEGFLLVGRRAGRKGPSAQAPWEDYWKGKVEGVLCQSWRAAVPCWCAPRPLQSQRTDSVSCPACLVMQLQYFLRVLLENIGDISTTFSLRLKMDSYSCISHV